MKSITLEVPTLNIARVIEEVEVLRTSDSLLVRLEVVHILIELVSSA